VKKTFPDCQIRFLVALFVWGLIAKLVAAAEKIQVYFSPNGGCNEAVVKNLNKAQSSIYVQGLRMTVR